MANTYKALVEKMGAVYSDMKALVDAANEGDGMNAEVEAKYSSLKTQYAALTAQRQRNEEMMGIEKASFVDEIPDAPQLRSSENRGRHIAPQSGDVVNRAFETYLKQGEYTSPQEMRAISEASGGTALPPIEYHQQLAAKLKTASCLRQIAKVMPVGSFSRQIAIEGTTGTAYWKAEAAAFAESGSTFTSVTLTPSKLTGLLKVSNELVEDAPARGAGFSIESILVEQFARMFAQAEETAFLATAAVTDGPQNPLLSTVSTGKTAASASAITAAEVIDWIYSLPRQYRTNASIVVHDATLGKFRQLGSVAGTANYFWQNSGVLGEPDRLLGIPVYASAAMPVIATTAKIGLIGDFGNYCVIAERASFSLKVLKELYAATGQTGYICSTRVDCAATQTDAFRVLAMA